MTRFDPGNGPSPDHLTPDGREHLQPAWPSLPDFISNPDLGWNDADVADDAPGDWPIYVPEE